MRPWGSRTACRALRWPRDAVLYLLLHLRNDRYAIDATQIEEVIPFVDVKELPGAPRGVAGLIDYYGQPVPVLDLSLIALGAPTSARMSARIVLVWYEPDSRTRRLIGLLVPRATDVLRSADVDFLPAGVATPDARYLGNVLPHANGLIQRIRVADLVTPDIRRAMSGAQDAA